MLVVDMNLPLNLKVMERLYVLTQVSIVDNFFTVNYCITALFNKINEGKV